MINFNKVLVLSFILVLSGCSFSFELFRENPLNGCSSQKSGKWCPSDSVHKRVLNVNN